MFGDFSVIVCFDAIEIKYYMNLRCQKKQFIILKQDYPFRNPDELR